LKLTSTGSIDWQKTYGGTGSDSAQSIQQTSDGGYIVAGVTQSFGTGSADFWVLKLTSTGSIDWQKTYGGTGYDRANSIQQTADGGYVVAGNTTSFGAGSNDFWVLKLNNDGTVAWQKTYGGTGGETANSIRQTADGGYIVAGNTPSFGAGSADFWVLKLNPDGTCPPLGQNTTVSPVDTNVTPVDTTVTPADTSATVTDTSVTGVDTNAAVNQQAP
ncbi:MAG: hypothetical protein QME16_05630, partial [Planctomycetota bacterium]|nr:hypothetical protein [Planctomycetota bacterium]